MNSLENYISRYTTIEDVKYTLLYGRIKLYKPIPQYWTDKNDLHYVNLFKKSLKKKSAYFFCATRSQETFHHWKVFGKQQKAACIQFKRDKLERAVKSNNCSFHAVEYLKIEQLNDLKTKDLNRLAYMKRIGYSDENEYRIIYTSCSRQKASKVISIPHECISTIIINPFVSANKAANYIEELKSFSGKNSIKFRKSTLTDSARWQKAGTDFVNRCEKAI